MTYKELGKALGVSRQAAQQYVESILAKLAKKRVLQDLATALPDRQIPDRLRTRTHYEASHEGSGYDAPLSDRERYPDWDARTSYMVSGPIGPFSRGNFPGRWFASMSQARAYWRERCGRILEERYLLGRYAFRVPRPTAKEKGPTAQAVEP